MKSHPTSSKARHSLALVVGCALVAAAYWIGLRGPLLLDDFANLADVTAWLDGHRTWQSTITNNRSGPGGRPVSMATFVMDGAFWGKSIWHFKLTNLLLHLLCGIVAWCLLRRLLARDVALSRHTTWLALLLSLVWLALPIHASSVLYVVQRMAILSTLFSLLALWLYVTARELIDRGERRGTFALLLGVPTLTGVAFLSKENGALVPLLALAIEVGYFQSSPGHRRRSVRCFFTFFLALPALLAFLGMALNPQWLWSGYELREFSPSERLLTQARILWEYVGTILLPHGPSLGLFHDNYPKSTGLFSPWSTLAAVVAWVVSLATAWRLRAKYPAILAGGLLFLAGHAMESSILPLELYFEHRNYLPSLGILLCIAGIAAALINRIPRLTPRFPQALAVGAIATFAVLLGTTHGRARVWSSIDTLYAQELIYNPESPRLHSFLAGSAMRAGDLEAALKHISAAEQQQSPRQAMTSTLWRLLAYCSSNEVPSPALYHEMRERAVGRIETFAMNAWEQLAKRLERGDCQTLDAERIIAIAESWINQTPSPRNSQQSWRSRYYLARLLAWDSQLETAALVGEQAWIDSDFNSGIGVFLFQVNASLGRTEKCQMVLDRLRNARGGDILLNRAIDTFEAALLERKIGGSHENVHHGADTR